MSQIISFPLKTDYIELAQLLKASGIASTGGQAKLMIDDGLVQLDGHLEIRKGRKIRSGQVVQIENVIIQVE